MAIESTCKTDPDPVWFIWVNTIDLCVCMSLIWGVQCLMSNYIYRVHHINNEVIILTPSVTMFKNVKKLFNTCHWSHLAASSRPVSLSSVCQNMTGALRILAPTLWRWENQLQSPASQKICLHTSLCSPGYVAQTPLTRHVVLAYLYINNSCMSYNKVAGMKIMCSHGFSSISSLCMICMCTPTYLEWAPRRPATSRWGWKLSVGTWDSARTRWGCVWRPVPWEPVCLSHLFGTHGLGFPLGQSDGRIWQWLWKTWLRQTKTADSWKREASIWPYFVHWKAKSKDMHPALT